jgi:hypothetical protein
MFQVFVGFIPWIIYWSFSGPGLWTVAILGGMTAAAGLVSWRWIKRRDIKSMEAVTLGYFIIHAMITLVLSSSFMKTYGPIASSLVLAGMAFATLAVKNPFTYQYAGVMLSGNPADFSCTPIRFRSLRDSLTGSMPATRNEPPLGVRKPSRHSNVLVFPAPLGTSNPNTSPFLTSKLIPSTAT